MHRNKLHQLRPKLAQSHPTGSHPDESQAFFFTFQAADPPQPRVGEGPGVFPILVVGIVLADVGRAVADDSSGVQPVVRPDCHRHQAEGGEGPHGGEEDLDPLLTHHAFIQGKEEKEDIGNKNQSGVSLQVQKNTEVTVMMQGRMVGGGEGGGEKR